jgi:MscS family membrane protein
MRICFVYIFSFFIGSAVFAADDEIAVEPKVETVSQHAPLEETNTKEISETTNKEQLRSSSGLEPSISPLAAKPDEKIETGKGEENLSAASTPDTETELTVPPMTPVAEHAKMGAATTPAEIAPEQALVVQPDDQMILSYIDQLDAINRQLPSINSEDKIDEILRKQNELLSSLVPLLRKTKIGHLPAVGNMKLRGFLKSRIKINEEHGNELAVLRDHLELGYYQTIQDIRNYLQYLISASNNYDSVENIISKSVEKLNTSREVIKKFSLPESEERGTVYTKLESNFIQFSVVHHTFQDILSFVINHPNEIAKIHWFQRFSLLSTIAFFNQLDFVKPINYKLLPLRVDFGGIVVSLAIVMMVFFCYPLAVKGISLVVEKYLISGDETGNSELIYNELNRPIRALIVFFSLDLATYALLYKTEYKASLDNFTFVIYAWIYVWVLYKLLDSVVVAQITKLTRTNKELRKELINLGIQVAKGVILIIALAIVLNRYGISISAILSTLGIGGLAFALAAKDTLSNLFGGVTILFDNVFRMGDWVKISDVEGTVVVIGLRSTTIRTFDNALITIPNALVSVSSVKNWNRRAIGRRIKMHIGVTYESNMDNIRQALEDIKIMLREHPGIANPKEKHTNKSNRYRFSSHEDTQGIKSTQLVFLDRYNDFSIDIMIYCFSRTVNWSEWLAVKEDILFKIAEILASNQLEFAYPTAVRLHRMEKTSEAEKSVTVSDHHLDSLA